MKSFLWATLGGWTVVTVAFVMIASIEDGYEPYLWAVGGVFGIIGAMIGSGIWLLLAAVTLISGIVGWE